MAKYRKKPVVIEAIQLRWDTWQEMCDHAGVGKLTDGKPEGSQDGEKIQLNIPTPEGLMTADENDWIIRGIKGELYPCRPDIFEATYELVGEAPTSDAEIVFEWLAKHQKADFITADKDKTPAIAVYINPVYRYNKNTENLAKYLLEYIQMEI